MASRRDIGWLYLWLHDPAFHANVTMVSQELARQVRLRMTG